MLSIVCLSIWKSENIPIEYEYFIVRIGEAPYEGFGMSIKKGSTDSELDGVAFRIYGCGIYRGDGAIFVRDEIIVPLESVVILPGS